MKQAHNLDTRLHVYLKKMDKTTTNSLKYFFTAKLGNSVHLSNIEKDANLLLVEYERNLDRNFLNELSQGDKYALVLHMKAEDVIEHPRLFWVKRPISVKQLTTTIFTIGQLQVKSKNVKSSNPIETSSSTEVPLTGDNTDAIKKQNHKLSIITNHQTDSKTTRFYKDHKYVGSNQNVGLEDQQNHYIHPERYIYYYLAKAKKMAEGKHCVITIKTVKGDIYFDADSQLFLHDFKGNNLSALHAMPIFSKTSLTSGSKQKLINQLKYLKSKGLELIWESALMASKGRLPEGTSMDAQVNMVKWPNFTRLTTFNYAIQISAVWSKNHLSIYQTAAELNIPQRYVFTLFTAMNAIGCASVGNKSNDQKMVARTKNSLFTKIMNHIFTKKEPN